MSTIMKSDKILFGVVLALIIFLQVETRDGKIKTDLVFIFDDTCLPPSLLKIQNKLVKAIVKMVELLDIDTRVAAIHTLRNGNDESLPCRVLFSFNSSNHKVETMVEGIPTSMNLSGNGTDLFKLLKDRGLLGNRPHVPDVAFLLTDGCNFQSLVPNGSSTIRETMHTIVVLAKHRSIEHQLPRKRMVERCLKFNVASDNSAFYILRKKTDVPELAALIAKKIRHVSLEQLLVSGKLHGYGNANCSNNNGLPKVPVNQEVPCDIVKGLVANQTSQNDNTNNYSMSSKSAESGKNLLNFQPKKPLLSNYTAMTQWNGDVYICLTTIFMFTAGIMFAYLLCRHCKNKLKQRITEQQRNFNSDDTDDSYSPDTVP